ncbi:TIGR02281 family clan AA aspartic protease [Sinorhizobium sp. BG8]|uniref:TIGR02281 family clan AA aspartic protease n=1 Tax=Sinorhizobium sp. BG8 TaxID=2613773 RepID=UPI00193DB560|nr:TIGR02281 family clan AA aspartic protease [Sinorhizobium sp. BG8]QRM53789.1 TIGR02281 family clan AA aspartic protease [Sinorhizobium sp. BG8]
MPHARSKPRPDRWSCRRRLLCPGLAKSYLETAGRDQERSAANEVQPAAPVSQARYTGNRGATIVADENGHFSGLFTINGRKEQGMIDTGASMVAINLSTALRLGVPRKKIEFRYAVDTANGKARAAYVRLDRIGIGSISVDNVGAMVLDDKSLSGTLIGMNFLKGISSYHVEGKEMRLMR